MARVVGGEADVAGATTGNFMYTLLSSDVTSSVESIGVNDSNSRVSSSSENTKSSEEKMNAFFLFATFFVFDFG